MTRQKSESSIVPEGLRKRAPTEPARGGKGVPVHQEKEQLGLPFATAESPKGTVFRTAVDRSTDGTGAAPKAKNTSETEPSATMERVIGHLDEALAHVVRNRGAPGPNGRTVRQIQNDWPRTCQTLRHHLLQGTYQPGTIRRVEIPKPGGGTRDLGIPNVEDRVVQEAIRLCLEPKFEPGFHSSSHGFRPKRSCHTALSEARRHVEAGHHVVADLDLSKFFDRVNHQRLMARVSTQVEDARLRWVISRLLKAGVVLPDGVVCPTTEGVPQGGIWMEARRFVFLTER